MSSRLRCVAVISAAVATVLMISSCSSPNPADGQAGAGAAKSLTIGVNAPPYSFEQSQLHGGGDEMFWRAVYTTLLSRNEKGELIPDAAESWSYNEDKTVLTLNLRSGMTFTDGSPVDADAVVKNLTNYKDGHGAAAAYLINMKSAAAEGKLTVNVTLATQDPGFTYYLSMSAGTIADPKTLTAADAGSNPQGSGPYVLDVSHTSIGSTYTFSRNENYWDLKSYPYKTVVMKVIPDATGQLNALRSGQIDAGRLTGATAEAAKASGLNVTTESVTVQALEIRDTTGKTVPALANQKVRQAMNLAFDREAIVKNLVHGYGEPTDQLFVPGEQSYLSTSENKYDFDVEEAKKLMSEAGYSDGFDLTLPISSGYAFLQTTVQQSLGAIGVRVNWQAVPDALYANKTQAGDFPVYFGDPTMRNDWIDLGLWIAPGAQWNTFNPPSEDPQLTSLIGKAKTASSAAEEKDAYQNIGSRLLDLAWFIPLHRDKLVNVTTNKVSASWTPGVNVPLIQNYRPVEG